MYIQQVANRDRPCFRKGKKNNAYIKVTAGSLDNGEISFYGYVECLYTWSTGSHTSPTESRQQCSLLSFEDIMADDWEFVEERVSLTQAQVTAIFYLGKNHPEQGTFWDNPGPRQDILAEHLKNLGFKYV